MAKTTVSAFAKRREAGEKLVMITAGSAAESAAAQAAGIDLILVGDSLGMTMLGFDTTLPVTMEMMLHHAAAVRRGAPEAFVIFDMPFMSYQTGIDEAVRNAGRALQETGADAVKLEGGADPELVRRLVTSGIPVLGHLGLLPQHIQTVGAYRVVGRAEAAAEKLVAEARALEAAGAFALVLECVPEALGRRITETLHIPTIGIGSGAACSGQVQVLYDTLGLTARTPKHAKRFAELGETMRRALAEYAAEVRSGTFPAEENTFK
jgi:3-methyl-2-oxobutanoate hydroxymethyltransferase